MYINITVNLWNKWIWFHKSTRSYKSHEITSIIDDYRKLIIFFSIGITWTKKLAKIINKLQRKISLLSKKKWKLMWDFAERFQQKTDLHIIDSHKYSWFSMPSFFFSIGMKSTKKNGLKKVKKWNPTVKSAPGPPIGMGSS